jgi:hypothetical protein
MVVALLLWTFLIGSLNKADASLSWPNAFDEFEHGGWSGVLELRREAVHRDFRIYYRVVVLELLLVHHGMRACESSRGDDQYDLAKTRRAIEAFQRAEGMPVDSLKIGADFWQSLQVPVQPGQTSSAVLTQVVGFICTGSLEATNVGCCSCAGSWMYSHF